MESNTNKSKVKDLKSQIIYILKNFFFISNQLINFITTLKKKENI